MQDPPLGKDVNEVKAIRVRNGSVEIVLHSSREFPVRSDVVVLRIGKQDFFKSHPPEDGSLHTLIFTISAEDFAALAPGLQMTVRYGKREPDPEDMPGVARVDRWDFGKLDKGIVGG